LCFAVCMACVLGARWKAENARKMSKNVNNALMFHEIIRLTLGW
jgi:hypothetical protein